MKGEEGGEKNSPREAGWQGMAQGCQNVSFSDRFPAPRASSP
jgi:hypothetical protein